MDDEKEQETQATAEKMKMLRTKIFANICALGFAKCEKCDHPFLCSSCKKKNRAYAVAKIKNTGTSLTAKQVRKSASAS